MVGDKYYWSIKEAQNLHYIIEIAPFRPKFTYSKSTSKCECCEVRFTMLDLLGMYFDAAVVFVANSSLLYRFTPAILC